MKDPQAFCDGLKEVYKLKLKDVGPVCYHLGCRSEFVAARIATDQIIDLRYTLNVSCSPNEGKKFHVW